MSKGLDKDTIGVALLVSNDYSTLKEVQDLPFTHSDTDNLEKLFKEFTYLVYRRKNVSIKEFVSCYKALADFKYPLTCKRILVYFSGHGDDGALLMQDGGKVQIESVISSFKIHIANNETLAEMAKLFFFDACRGSHRDEGYSKSAKPDNEITCLGRVPKEGNTLVAYASTRYHVSYGGPAGSRWTTWLIKALRESEERDDVCNVLTGANIMMRNEPNQHCFQTAEFISNLTGYVRFKQEGIKMRSILVIGKPRSGKSSVINRVIGEDYLDVKSPGYTNQHVHRKLVINNSKYQCTFIEIPGSFYYYNKPISYHVEKIAKSHLREHLQRLHLIIHVFKHGRFTVGERETFKMYMNFFKNAQRISALVITHCESFSDEHCTGIVKEWKSNEQTRDIAASMGKGIYTVGFPKVPITITKPAIQEDVSKLHQLIKESSDTVDVVRDLDIDLGYSACSIM